MTPNGAITIYLSPEISEEDLGRIKEKIQQIVGGKYEFEFDVNADSNPGGSPSDDSRKSKDDSKSISQALKDYISDDKNKQKLVTSAIRSTETAISTSLKKGFGIVEDIFGRLKAASPLLQAIESLFNLAMQLFFMPLGNKLAEVLIPATLELVDNVVKMWDSFEGMTLSEMFTYAINNGVKLVGGYFTNIGDLLVDQGGLVGGIGRTLQVLGDFIQGPGVAAIEGILNVVNFMLANFKHFVSLWVAMKTAELIMDSLGFFKNLGADIPVRVGALAVLASATATGVTSELLMTGLGNEKGGYVPATPGGQIRVLGEGGQGEYVVPEDKYHQLTAAAKGQSPKVDTRLRTLPDTHKDRYVINDGGMSAMGGNSMTLNFYGYNEDQLVQKVNDTVSQQISQSRLRSGF